jgi:SRSO17 transposase
LGIFDDLMIRVGARFRRVEPRRRARAFVLGLLAELPRKNCWTIAEHAGDRTPDGMQYLLARARWDPDGVRDDLRACVIEHLSDPGAVLVVDETGDVKKGTATPGVQRQYTGTAGRIENAQVAVYLGYAAPRGHALIDRELYLPKSWTGDPGRCQAAGIPADVTFATKPQLGRRMIERAVTAKVPFAWVAGDEVYGDNGPLRTWLEAQQIRYVLAVACDHRVPAAAKHSLRADELAARLPPRAWQRLSAGTGAKGHRWYDWAWATIADPGPGCRYLLIRRSRRTGELAVYRCWSPLPVTLHALVTVAGLHWTVEENFLLSGSSSCCTTWRLNVSRRGSATPQPRVVYVVVAAQSPADDGRATYATSLAAFGEVCPWLLPARFAKTRLMPDLHPERSFQAGKGLTGLDEHQARRWASWYRWVTLAMLAAAFLTIAAALEHAHPPGPAQLIPLTRNEIAHLLATTIARPAPDASHRMRWSRWRRHHQYRSRACHYQQQSAHDLAT